jgi:glucose-6-phosphate isomerase
MNSIAQSLLCVCGEAGRKSKLAHCMALPFGTISENVARIEWSSGTLESAATQRSVKRLGELAGLFLDERAWLSMNPGIAVYSVEWQQPVKQDTPAGLFWGSTRIEPGKVGGEYFMTFGHFHARRDRAEYYCVVQGQGMLLLMDEERRTRVEIMSPGSLHYIPGHTAHRAVNTGATPLLFWACWPSDAGHDYETIARRHFSARVFQRNGKPEVVPDEPEPGPQPRVEAVEAGELE